MKLTRKQWVNLTAYRKWHQEGLSLWRLYRGFAWEIVAVLAMTAGGAVLCFIYGPTLYWAGLLLAGVGIGFFAQTLGYSLLTVAVWPIVDRITDWDRVDQLLNEVGSPPPRGINWLIVAGIGPILLGGLILVRDRTKLDVSVNKREVVTLSADEFLDEWEQGPEATTRKYATKDVDLTGEVTHVAEAQSGDYHLTLEGSKPHPSAPGIEVYFPEKPLATKARAYPIGSTMTVRVVMSQDPRSYPRLIAADIPSGK
jgi:hypothetical protein